MTTQFLASDLERDEGRRLLAYQDSRGIWTIGVGHNIEADSAMRAQFTSLRTAGITDGQCLALLQSDITSAEARLDVDLPWWRELDDVRQDVMVNLAFNLGPDKLATWKHTLGDIQAGNFHAADIDLLNDEPWASQVHDRAKRLAWQMETGVRAYSVSPATIDEPVPAPPEATPAPVEAEPLPASPTSPATPVLPPSGAPDATASQLPSVPQSVVGSAIRHGLTGIGFLAPFVGSLSPSQLDQLVGWLTAVVFVGAPLLWAWWKARQTHKAVAAALATPAPGQVLPTLSQQDIDAIAKAVRAQTAAPAG